MDVADYFRLRDAAVLAGGEEFHRFLVSQGRYKSPEQEEITLLYIVLSKQFISGITQGAVK